nr:MAG TPA: hypothetical protein [Crassvirales sp.]
MSASVSICRCCRFSFPSGFYTLCSLRPVLAVSSSEAF